MDIDFIKQVLSPDYVIKQISSDNLEDAYRELIDCALANEELANEELCLTDILEREKIGSTYLGNGVALPHSVTEGIGSFRAVLGLKKEGLKIPEAADKDKVQIMLLCLCPEEERKQYLRFIYLAARVLMMEDNRQDLLTAQDNQEICEIMQRI